MFKSITAKFSAVAGAPLHDPLAADESGRFLAW
jgi:hypothetical protein